MNAIVLDTCILLDNYLGNRPNAKASRALIDFCLAERIPLLYSAASIGSVAYLIENALKTQTRESGTGIDESTGLAARRAASACIESLQLIATAVGVDDSDIWLARKYQSLHDDFEDNLVLAAVERSKADFLVTSDEKLIKHAPCAAFDPQSMLDYLKISCSP